MRFVLNEYHRNVPSETLLADLRQVAQVLGRSVVTKEEQDKHGKYDSSTLARRFGSWNKAVEAAGLDLTHRMNIPDEELLSDVLAVSRKLGRNWVTCLEQDEHGRFNSSTLSDRFGKWTNALKQVGLDHARTPRNVSNEELLENLEEVWTRLGRQPAHGEMRRPHSLYSAGTYARAFGSWRKALEAFVNSIETEAIAKDDGIDRTTPSMAETEVSCFDTPIDNHFGLVRDKRHIGWRLRFLVMRRDNFKCKACGRTPAADPTVTLDVDHIEAWSKGGPTVLENLQTLCTKCNIGKSDLDFLNPSPTEVQNVQF